MSYVLTAEGIGRSFGRTEVLKSASLWAEPGKITTVMGRNGAGKTTLLRIAAGWLRADYGVVHFGGEATEHPRLARMAKAGLFFIPQEQLLSPTVTGQQHLDAVCAVFGSEYRDAAIAATRTQEILAQPVWELSGGERMRLSLALGMARRPVCLIIDEPLAGVSPKDQDLLSKALRVLADEGTAVVTSGHDARALLRLSDVIIWCVAGTTHHIGTPREALGHQQFVREYLGPGYADLRETLDTP